MTTTEYAAGLVLIAITPHHMPFKLRSLRYPSTKLAKLNREMASTASIDMVV